MKKIVISGATGFIGSHLTKYLSQHDYEVVHLTRLDLSLSDNELSQKMNGVYAVINLTGAPILHRWTKSYKEELYTSRIKTTQKIANAIRLAESRPELFISTSAVGVYRNKTTNTERAANYDNNFLGKICRDWEASAMTTMKLTRTVIFRLGVVLSNEGGALKEMLSLFKLGLGGKIGKGDQGFSWVHLEDLMQAYLFTLEHTDTEGIYNVTAPEIVTNDQFTKTLASVLHRPAIITVSLFSLKMLYGQGAVALTEGAFVEPFRLKEAGFGFQYPTLMEALKQIIKKQN